MAKQPTKADFRNALDAFDMRVADMSIKRNTAQGTLDLNVTFILPTKPPPSDIDAGGYKFFVNQTKCGVCVAMGATNIHHAFNKATKLFGPHWTTVSMNKLDSCRVVEADEFRSIISEM